MIIKKIGALEIEKEAENQDLLFWKVQKIVIILLILFLIGNLFGLTGSGIFDKRIITTDDKSLSVEYNVFTRKNAPAILTLHLNENESILTKTVTVWVSQLYNNKHYIKQIIPLPLYTENKNGNILFYFSINSKKPIITFMLEPQEAGFIQAQMGVDDKQPLSFQQFIYP